MIKIEKLGYMDPRDHRFIVTGYNVKLFGKVVLTKGA